MQSEPLPIQIALTPRFKRDLRELAKRYRSIRSDIQPLFVAISNPYSSNCKQVKFLEIELLELNIRFSKLGSKIVIFKREKVEAIESFIT